MSKKSISESQLKYIEFLNRENDFRHHQYNEEMLQYEYLKVGNPEAIEESVKMFSSKVLGHLSDDPVRNTKYLFIASITLATRFAIEGGMDEETAYNTSDLYIQKVDKLQSKEEISSVHKEMFTYFTKHLATLNKKNIYSKPVVQCMDYIYYHLYEKISIEVLAKYVKLNPNYLSTIFKKETGISASDYITNKRIESASNMLKYSDYTYAEISSYLAFSSQSYFTQVFKKNTGFTPKEYRQKFFKISFSHE